MASIKVILRTSKKNGKGECPLYLRLIRHRKANFVSIGLYIQESDWEPITCKVKKSHRNSGRLNAFIAQKVADAEAIVIDNQTKVNTVSSKKLKEKIVGIEPVNFFDYSNRYVDTLLNGHQIATYKRAKAVIQKLKDYNESKPLYLGDITHTYLQDFEQYCITEFENRPNTIHGNLRIIRKIINDAIRDDKMSRDDNPFLKLTLKTETSKRNYLLEEEVKEMEKLNLSATPGYQHTRDMFVFACYAGGVRISDLLVLQWKDIVDGRLVIRMKKTGGTQMVKLPQKALDILAGYRTDESKPDNFVFPYVTCKEDIDTPMKLHNYVGKKTALCNKNLKEIASKVENTHILTPSIRFKLTP
ncbi:MAG: site-specific integrase [Bacteroidota bacterium]